MDCHESKMELRRRRRDSTRVLTSAAPCAGRRGLVSGVLMGGCASMPQNTVDEMLKPSNDRNWKANMAVLPYARIRDDRVTVYNVRNCSYITEDDYVLNYEDRSYRSGRCGDSGLHCLPVSGTGPVWRTRC